MEEAETSLLPVLNDAELRAIFPQDERAIWRYHVLAALLLRGQAARDVAQQFDTTVETVRNLKTTFLATGHLDALRSKRRGAAGHLSRQTPLAQEVARELAADPTASGGTIWRRVQARLGERGVQVPRRSVYRIIDRLRPSAAEPEESEAGSDLWAPALVPAIRAALPLLRLDPPVDLGKSELATQLLGSAGDPLGRGEQLRVLLYDALEQLRPPPDTDPQDPSSRPYQVLTGEALRGLGRDELQGELAIAPATYTRAKRQGLDQLAELLVQEVQSEQQTAPRAAPPPAPPLLGRESALSYFAERLDSEGEAVIWGIAGCGKTALAATLAAQYQKRGELVAWHSCAGSGDDLLRQLLASLGLPETGQSLDTESLLGAIRSQLRAGGLLVLDTYERIAEDQTAALLMALIQSLVGQRSLRLLISSRVLPSWAQHQGWLPLGGLIDDMARAHWTISGGPATDAATWHTIYSRTLGYPRLIELLAATPGGSLAPFLLEQVCGGLSQPARQILHRTLLARRPLSVYDADADDPAMQRAYAELLQRGLLTRQTDRSGLYLHGVLRAGREELLSQIPDAPAINRLLGAQATAARHWLDAARYFAAAGGVVTAMRVIGEHAEELVAQQRGREAIELLRQLLLQLTPGAELSEMRAYIGSVHLALGAYREALDALSAALDLANAFRNAIPIAEVRRWHHLVAIAYLQLGQWDRALSHAQISMGSERSITAEVPAHERIKLTLLQHRIWLMSGHKDQAQYWLADAQMLVRAVECPDGAAQVACAEGLAALRRGAFGVAEPRLRAALEALPPDRRHSERFTIAAQLGLCLVGLGQFDAAQALLRSTLVVSQSLRHRTGTVELGLALVHATMTSGAIDDAWALLNLPEALLDQNNRQLHASVLLARGWLMLHGADAGSAHQPFVEAINLSSNPPLPEIQAEANLGLAVLYLQQGDATTAVLFAQRAIRFADTTDQERIRSLAVLCLAREALLRHAYAEAESLIAQIRSDPADRLIGGSVERLLAELAAARGAYDEADRLFRQSLETLHTAPALARNWAQQSYQLFLAPPPTNGNAAQALKGARQKPRGPDTLPTSPLT